MPCQHCGAELRQDQLYCTSCGNFQRDTPEEPRERLRDIPETERRQAIETATENSVAVSALVQPEILLQPPNPLAGVATTPSDTVAMPWGNYPTDQPENPPQAPFGAEMPPMSPLSGQAAQTPLPPWALPEALASLPSPYNTDDGEMQPPGLYQSPAKPKKKKPKALAIVLPGVALFIAGVILLVMVLQDGFVASPNPGAFGEEPMATMDMPADMQNYPLRYVVEEDVHILGVGSGLSFQQNKEYQEEYSVDSSGATCFFTRESAATENIELYYTDFYSEEILLAKDAWDILLSPDGNTVFFRGLGEYSALWKISVGSSTPQIVAENVSRYVVSPDGSHVLHSIYGEQGLYITTVGKLSKKILGEKKVEPCAISNDGKIFVYSGTKFGADTLFFCDSTAEKPLAVFSFEFSGSVLHINRSGEDMLLQCKKGLFRYTKGVFARIDSGEKYNVTPLLGTILGDVFSSIHCFYYTGTSFSSFFYTSTQSAYQSAGAKSGLYYKTAGGGVVQVVSSEQHSLGASVAGNGTVVFATVPDDSYLSFTLLRFSVDAGGTIAVDEIDQKVRDFQHSADGKTLFYTKVEYDDKKSYSTLFCKHEGKPAEKIASNVMKYAIGGSSGTSCTYIVGGVAYEGIGGQACLFTRKEGNAAIAEDVLYIGPPTADNAFYLAGNPTPLANGYGYYTDLSVYKNGEMFPVSLGVTLAMRPFNEDFMWYYQVSMF